jgi:hypothetical protein
MVGHSQRQSVEEQKSGGYCSRNGSRQQVSRNKYVSMNKENYEKKESYLQHKNDQLPPINKRPSGLPPLDSNRHLKRGGEAIMNSGRKSRNQGEYESAGHPRRYDSNGRMGSRGPSGSPSN